GFVTGSCRACRSASSNRFASASPFVFSVSTDCWKSASRRAAASERMRCASLSSGLSARSGSWCDTTRPRFTSTTSVAWQHGQTISTSLVSFAIGSSPPAAAAQDETNRLTRAVGGRRLDAGDLLSRREPLPEARHEHVERCLEPLAGRNLLPRDAVVVVHPDLDRPPFPPRVVEDGHRPTVDAQALGPRRAGQDERERRRHRGQL